MAAPHAHWHDHVDQLQQDLAFLQAQGPANNVYVHDLVPIFEHILAAMLPAEHKPDTAHKDETVEAVASAEAPGAATTAAPADAPQAEHHETHRRGRGASA